MRVVAILAIIMAVVGVGLAWPVLTREAIRRRNREAMIRIGRSFAGMGVAIAGFTAAGGAAVKAFMEFEEAMNEVGAIMGATNDRP